MIFHLEQKNQNSIIMNDKYKTEFYLKSQF